MSSTTIPPPAAPVAAAAPEPATRRRMAQTSLLAHGQPLVWLTGGAVIICVFMIAGLLLLVVVQGLATFWPQPVIEATLRDGKTRIMGEVVRTEAQRSSDPASQQDQRPKRELVRIGNFEFTNEPYRWVDTAAMARVDRPEWGLVIERLTNDGRFYGTLTAFRRHPGRQDLVEQAVACQALALPTAGTAFLPQAVVALGTVTLDRTETTTDPTQAWSLFQRYHPSVMQRVQARTRMERDALGAVNRREREARLAVAQAELDHGPDSAAVAAAQERNQAVRAAAAEEVRKYHQEIAALNQENQRFELVLQTAQGRTKVMNLGDIDRAYPANQVTFGQKLGIYLARWWEFLTAEPRKGNSEGGVWPAIWGTAVMTILMSLAVVPFGVMAALYLREYAKGGPIISLVRIAINNLAGVPSIVFGVFGLGFFCYIVGDSIDNVFFQAQKVVDRDPTFGKGGLLWASLTLALLTLPVVIVATEEALAAVPRSVREGSYACGASKWQTIWRIVLPRALPGILTGMILAMARGAGEVAPLMLVGAKKIAQDLPVDGVFPFVHPDRSFMHLGFHIYDVGFQSPDSESAKPMVFTTTLLLIVLIFALNLAAMWLRARLRRRHRGGHF